MSIVSKKKRSEERKQIKDLAEYKNVTFAEAKAHWTGFSKPIVLTLEEKAIIDG